MIFKIKIFLQFKPIKKHRWEPLISEAGQESSGTRHAIILPEQTSFRLKLEHRQGVSQTNFLWQGVPQIPTKSRMLNMALSGDQSGWTELYGRKQIFQVFWPQVIQGFEKSWCSRMAGTELDTIDGVSRDLQAKLNQFQPKLPRGDTHNRLTLSVDLKVSGQVVWAVIGALYLGTSIFLMRPV